MWLKWKNKTLLFVSIMAIAGFSFFQNCSQNKTYQGGTSTQGSLDVPDTDEPIDKTDYVEKAQVSKLVANRVLISNMFLSVFGPGVKNLAALNLAYHEKDFGSGFSIYEGVVTADCTKNKNILQPCVSTVTDPQTASNVGLNVRREAWRIRTCHSAVAMNPQLLFALKKFEPKATMTSLPEVTEANLDNAYRLFFRAAPLPDNQLMDALSIIAQKDSDPLKKWQNVILTLCLSPHWQVL